MSQAFWFWSGFPAHVGVLDRHTQHTARTLRLLSKQKPELLKEYVNDTGEG